MITVKNISKSFAETKAVADLSFSIGSGEIVGLLGPNGAGKTTTMRMLTGFLSADSGMIKIGDFDILQNPLEAQKIIGYMPENNPIYKEMLVSELFDFIANIRNIKGGRRREGIEFAVNSTGINEVYYYPIQELSKGFRQRVGMAMALLHRPAVLILDEPTEGLDPNQRTEVRHLIRKLAKGHTVLLSTHVMQEVEAVCSRIIIINNGRLVADGTPDKLIKTSGIKNSFVVTLEGKNVLTKLKTVKEITAMKVTKKQTDRISLRLQGRKETLPPLISQLAADNKWIIWKLNEEHENLEEVFQKLTLEN